MTRPNVDTEFQSLIPPLTEDEYRGLEKSLLTEGCRDALVVWKETGILLDGHNRLAICQKHNIDFDTAELGFDNRDDAMGWVIRNQFARRNLTPYQRAELALKLEGLFRERAKERQREHGGTAPGRAKTVVQNSAQVNDRGKTRDELARLAGISHDTITKAKHIAEKASEQTKEQLRRGEISINQAHKDIKKEERKALNVLKEIETARPLLSQKAKWTVTNDTSIVSCNVLITDPPYGILNKQWEPENLMDFTIGWAKLWNDCGADFMLVFFSQRFLFQGRTWFDDTLSNYRFQQLLIWHYPNNKSPQNRMGFKQTWEPIFFYRKTNSRRQVGLYGAEWGGDITDFDCHVAAVPQTNFSGTEFKQHAAQKPLSVMRWLVGTTSNPGELVCDPFCGSGTTGIAAVQSGRRFHGIDTDPASVELAKRRIGAYSKPKL